MAHTSRMDQSDKCAKQGFAAIWGDFWGSITFSYVDTTFKIMSFVSLLIIATAAPFLYSEYVHGGMEEVKASLLLAVPTFVGVYLIGYFWFYKNVYTPIHDVSVQLLAEQDALNAWPDAAKVNGLDIIDWQKAEIEEVIDTANDLNDQAGAVERLDFTAESLEQEVEGDLGDQFQSMVDQLEKLAGSLDETAGESSQIANQVRQASNNLNQASQELAEGADEASASLQETSSSIEEMASMVEQTANNAEQARKTAENASEVAEDGKTQIDEMAQTVRQINEDSEEIAETIDVIDDIAFQTNLLALNAAVEAANAGEHGAGFAVVADEVRQLAQRSAEAADEISDVIEKSRERTEEGVRKADQSQEVLDEILGNVGEVTERVQEIASAAEEQSGGIEEINKAMNELEQVTEQNTANADETASSSDELSAQSDQLESAVQTINEQVQKFDVRNRHQNGNGRVKADSAEQVGNGDQKHTKEPVVAGQSRENGDNGDPTPASKSASSEDEENFIPLEKDQGDF